MTPVLDRIWHSVKYLMLALIIGILWWAPFIPFVEDLWMIVYGPFMAEIDSLKIYWLMFWGLGSCAAMASCLGEV